MYNFILNLLNSMGVNNIDLNFCGQAITIYTNQLIAGLTTIILIGALIYMFVKIVLIPSKIIHKFYHKWAKKRNIK